MIIMESFPLQHREAVDKRPKLLLHPARAPAPLFISVSSSVDPLFPIPQPQPGHPISPVCLVMRSGTPAPSVAPCKRFRSHWLLPGIGNRSPPLFPCPTPPPTTSSFRWAQRTATISGRAEGREEGALTSPKSF